MGANLTFEGELHQCPRAAPLRGPGRALRLYTGREGVDAGAVRAHRDVPRPSRGLPAPGSVAERSAAASASGRACTRRANPRLCLPGGRLRACRRERPRAVFPEPGGVPRARPPSAGPGCPFKRGPGAVSIAAPGSFPLLPFRSAAIRGAAARAGPRDGQPRAAAGAAPPTAVRAAPRGLPRGRGASGHRGVAAGISAGRADAPESVCARRTAQ